MTRTFENLVVWKSGIELAERIYLLTNNEKMSKDYGFKDQIRRATVSIPSNIAEGHERISNQQFIYFLKIAKGSCGEVRTQLFLGLKLGYISEKEYERLYDSCIVLSKQLSALITYLKPKR